MRARSLQLLVLVSIAATCGCGTPASRLDALATDAGMQRIVVRGARFDHVAYVAPDAARLPRSANVGAERRAGPIWIYIEGDGVPWIDETIPSGDPTPRTPVALPAMIKGPRPAILLGRPCYSGFANTAPCEAIWWTHWRFSADVISSMSAALQQLRADRGWLDRRINLVGFSGGGTLAVLLAPHVEGLCAVVTLAAPLDTDEWTGRRGYSALSGSENPARLSPLPDALRQLHMRGELDRVVESDNGSEFRRRNPHAEFRVVPGLGHGTGWVRAWTDILETRASPALAHCTGA